MIGTAIVTAFAGRAAILAIHGVRLVQELEARRAELARKVGLAGTPRGRRNGGFKFGYRPCSLDGRDARR